jgi:hypothetical protein
MQITCGMLAEMIDNVTSKDTADVSIETAIEDIRGSDMTVTEWLCRLIPSKTLEALKAHSETPLWGEHAAKPEEIAC